MHNLKGDTHYYDDTPCHTPSSNTSGDTTTNQNFVDTFPSLAVLAQQSPPSKSHPQLLDHDQANESIRVR